MSNLYIKASYGSKAKTLTQEVANGTLRVTDSQELYVDINSSRLFLGSVVTGNTATQITGMAVANILPKIYLSSDTHKLYYYDTTGAAWHVVGGDRVAYADEAGAASTDASGNVITSTYETKSDAESHYNAINADIDALEAAIGDINSFEVRTAQNVDALPVPGKSNIIWFIPNDPITGDNNKYDEYIWFVNESETGGGHYENIGTTEADLGNYYTKSEVDSIESALQGSISALDTAYKAADEALDGRLDTLEAAVGSYPTSGVDDITTRLSGIDTAIGDDNTAASIKGRIKAAEGDIDALETAVGSDSTVGTIKGRIKAAEDDIDALETAVGDDNTAASIKGRIKALETDTASINRFEKEIVDELPAIADADPYTLYFVPEAGLAGADKKYAEYMYVAAHTIPADPQDPTSEAVTVPAHYERIDSTIDFGNYYTKSETDGIANNLQDNITANANDITALSGTVSAMDAAYKAADSALDGRVDTIEDALGSYPTAQGTQTITNRLATIEEALNGDGQDEAGLIADVAAMDTAYKAADEALDGRLDTVETAIGSYPTSGVDDITTRLSGIDTAIGDDSTAASIKGRITGAEGDIDDLEAAVGTYDVATDGTIANRLADIEAAIGQGSGDSLADRIDALEDEVGDNETAASIKGRITGLETEVGDDNTAASVKGRIKTAEDDIDAIETAIGDDSTAASIKGRITGAEGDIDALETAIGDDATANSVKGRIKTNEDDIDALETAIGDDATAASVKGRIKTAEDDIDAIETAIGDDNTAASVKGRIKIAEDDIDAVEAAIGTDSTSGTVKYRVKTLEDAVGDESTANTILYRIKAAEGDISDMDTAYKAADSNLQGQIDALENSIGQINKFEIVVLEAGEDLPATGELYTLYFKPQATDVLPGNANVYDEYMWVEKEVEDPETHEKTTEGHYEKVGVTEAEFANYYTKSEVDTITGAITDAIGDAATSGTIIYRIKTNEDDIDAIETAIGDDNTTTSIKGRIKGAEDDIDALETAVGTDSTAGTIKGRIKGAEDDIDALETAIGDDATAASVKGRIKGAEDDIDALETAIGDDATAASVKGRISGLEGRMTTAEGDIDNLETAIGDDATAASVKGRIKTAEDDIDALETAIGDDATAASVKGRIKGAEDDIDAIETAIGDDNTAASIKGRIKGAEDDIDALETAIGDDNTANSVKGRVKAAEDDIDDIEANIGTYDLATDGTIATRLADIEAAIGEGSGDSLADRIDALEDEVGDDSTANTIKGRITGLETEVASHDFKYAGSQTENGAADNVVETSSDANEEREVLLASHNKDAVEYTSSIKANPSSGYVKMNALKLGSATITFDAVTESLVVNF